MIKVFRGDDLDLTFYFKDRAGAVIDLTGCTLFATVKFSVEDTDAQAALSKTLTIDTVAGSGRLQATATEMLYLRGPYVLDLQLKTAAGVIETPFKTDFFVDEDVTIRTT